MGNRMWTMPHKGDKPSHVHTQSHNLSINWQSAVNQPIKALNPHTPHSGGAPRNRKRKSDREREWERRQCVRLAWPFCKWVQLFSLKVLKVYLLIDWRWYIYPSLLLKIFQLCRVGKILQLEYSNSELKKILKEKLN